MNLDAARDGQLFAKDHGDRVVPATPDTVFKSAADVRLLFVSFDAALDAEIENLRSRSKSQSYIDDWRNAAFGSFSQRIKTLTILARTA